MKAMILAAGYGTRLWPLTVDRTKPAIPFLGKPLVGYVAEYLSGYGFDDVVVNLHHRPESVRAALGNGTDFGAKFHYVEEKEILGPSGALDNAKHLLDGDTFIVVNGKIVTDIDLSKALDHHKRTGALATLVLLPNIKRERFTMVHTRDGAITGFGGVPDDVGMRIDKEVSTFNVDESEEQFAIRNPQSALIDVPLMFTGIQILEPRIFDYIPRGVFSHTVTDVYPNAIERGELLAAHIAEGKWYELSTIQRYLEISLAMNQGKNNGVIQGRRNSISSNALVNNSILWNDVVIKEGTRVERAILGDGVTIEAGDVIENAVVVRADLVAGEERPEKALKGEVKGTNFVVSLSQ